MADASDDDPRVPVRPDDVMLHAASLIHASGTFVFPYWLHGGTSAVLAGFDPEQYAARDRETRASAVSVVATMLAMLFATGADRLVDRARLQTVVYGASPMPRSPIEQALDAWGPRFVQYYAGRPRRRCASRCWTRTTTPKEARPAPALRDPLWEGHDRSIQEPSSPASCPHVVPSLRVIMEKLELVGVRITAKGRGGRGRPTEERG